MQGERAVAAQQALSAVTRAEREAHEAGDELDRARLHKVGPITC